MILDLKNAVSRVQIVDAVARERITLRERLTSWFADMNPREGVKRTLAGSIDAPNTMDTTAKTNTTGLNSIAKEFFCYSESKEASKRLKDYLSCSAGIYAFASRKSNDVSRLRRLCPRASSTVDPGDGEFAVLRGPSRN